jgi:hypothetical protein
MASLIRDIIVELETSRLGVEDRRRRFLARKRLADDSGTIEVIDRQTAFLNERASLIGTSMEALRLLLAHGYPTLAAVHMTVEQCADLHTDMDLIEESFNTDIRCEIPLGADAVTSEMGPEVPI